MKKSIIAMAVAGALAVPAIASADATLYGTMAVDGVFKNDTSANIDIDDAIIGLKGTVDLGVEGVTGFFDFRTEFDANSKRGDVRDGKSGTVTTDRALVGVTGAFGTVQAGTMGNPVEAVETLDVTSDGYATNNWFLNPGDLTNSLAYVTPSMSGFTGYAGIVVDGGQADVAGTEDDKDVDGYLLGFNYNIGGLTANVGYWNFDKNGTLGKVLNTEDGNGLADLGANVDSDYIGLSLSYAINESWSVTGNYAETELENAATKAEGTLWGLGTDYTMGNTTLGLTYVDFELEANGADTNLGGDEWALTASHALGNRAKVYAQYSDADLDDNTASDAGTRVMTVGYSISF